jgi:hypothetical protein
MVIVVLYIYWTPLRSTIAPYYIGNVSRAPWADAIGMRQVPRTRYGSELPGSNRIFLCLKYLRLSSVTLRHFIGDSTCYRTHVIPALHKAWLITEILPQGSLYWTITSDAALLSYNSFKCMQIISSQGTWSSTRVCTLRARTKVQW